MIFVARLQIELPTQYAQEIDQLANKIAKTQTMLSDFSD